MVRSGVSGRRQREMCINVQPFGQQKLNFCAILPFWFLVPLSDDNKHVNVVFVVFWFVFGCFFVGFGWLLVCFSCFLVGFGWFLLVDY